VFVGLGFATKKTKSIVLVFFGLGFSTTMLNINEEGITWSWCFSTPFAPFVGERP
jgi:hypothetical protein